MERSKVRYSDSLFTEIKYTLRPASIKSQFARVWLTLIVSFAVALFAMSKIAFLKLYFDIPVSYLTDDIVATTNSSFYTGYLSSLGIMIWTASAAICFFGASLIRRDHRSQYFRFLLLSGLLCLWLTLDDAFLLHEVVFPIYLNVPETLVNLTYCFIIAAYLFYFRQHIFKTDYFLLIISVLFLGSSLLIDQFFSVGAVGIFLEEGLKFSGILFWLGYFFRTTAMLLNPDRNWKAEEIGS